MDFADGWPRRLLSGSRRRGGKEQAPKETRAHKRQGPKANMEMRRTSHDTFANPLDHPFPAAV